jgi:hypothetical protein
LTYNIGMLQELEPLSDELLVIECKKDSKNFAVLVDRYVPKLTRYIRRRSLATRSIEISMNMTARCYFHRGYTVSAITK